MSDLIPLTANPNKANVLMLNTASGFAALAECAEQRLNAAYGLVDSLAHISLQHVASQDLFNVAEAVRILLADASDLYKAARTIRPQEGTCDV